jgi:Trypsin-co-occurring domain 1
MTSLIAVRLDDDTTALFEAADAEADEVVAAGRAGTVTAARENLRTMFAQLRPVLDTVTDQLRELPRGPDRYTVELGVTVTAESGLVVAKAAAEAHFTLTLEWNRPPGRAPEES